MAAFSGKVEAGLPLENAYPRMRVSCADRLADSFEARHGVSPALIDRMLASVDDETKRLK